MDVVKKCVFEIFIFSGKDNGAPLTWYNVKKGNQYRFRVIGVGSMYPIRISIDQHSLQVVASDGYDLKPMVVESFIINPGERFDFIVDANQTVGNYWVRGESIEVHLTKFFIIFFFNLTSRRNDFILIALYW